MADRGILIELEVGVPRLTALQPLYPETILSDPDALAIVAPAEGPLATLAAELQARLQERTGLDLPVVSEAMVNVNESLPGHLLALGDAANNQVLRRLHHLCYLDNGDYPAQGLQLTSVHSPLGDGHNVICVLGSEPEVVAAGAAQVLAHLVQRDGVWLFPGRLQVVEPTPVTPDPADILAAAAQVTPDSAGRPEHFRECLRHLKRTGDERWARAFVETLKPYATGFIPLSFVRMSAVDFWTDDVVLNWDACEEFPFFSDAERLLVANFVAALGKYCHDSLTYQKWRILPDDHQIFNHHTFPATGLFFAAMYLRRHGYELPELDDWLTKALRVMQRAATAGRSFDEGGSGYSWLVAKHLMKVSFAAGDFGYLHGDKLRHYADLAVMVQNNRFETVPYGDCGSYHAQGTLAGELLLRAAEAYQDPGYKWVALQHGGVDSKEEPFTTRRQEVDVFTRDLPAVAPDRHLGLFALSLDPVIYRWTGLPRFPGYPPPWIQPNVPVEECFDKLTFRGGWEPTDDYLLLQGFGEGQHSHPDANAISQYQARGRLFLVDNDYISRWPKEHNMLMILREGQHGPIPVTARLDNTLSFPGGAMTQSTLVDYNGCDWTRTLLWLSGDCLLAVDRVRAQVEGDYEIRCYWRTLGDAAATASGMHAEHSGEHFHVIELTDSARYFEAEPVPVNNEDHPLYDFGDGQAKRLLQTQRVHLRVGEETCFVNLLLPNGPTAAPRRQIQWSAPGMVLLTGDGPQVTLSPQGFQVAERGSYAFAPTERLDCLQKIPAALPPTCLPADLPTAEMVARLKLPAALTALVSGAAGEAFVGCADGTYGRTQGGEFQALGQAGGRVGALAYGAVFGELEPSLWVAAYDCTLRWCADDGRERRSVPLPRTPHMPAFGAALALADLDGDGRLWPIVGTGAWRVHALTPEGQFRWSFDTAAHSVTTLAVADLNGDGRDETVAGTVYYCLPAVTAEGERLWEDEDYNDFWTAGPIFRLVRIADVDGDGELEVASVGSDALLHCVDCRGVKKWTYSIGDEAAGLEVTPAGLAAASLTGDVHLVDGAGRQGWRTPLGSPCTAMTAEAEGLVVATADNRLVWLNLQGRPMRTAQLPAPATHLLITAPGEVLAATTTGELVRLRV